MPEDLKGNLIKINTTKKDEILTQDLPEQKEENLFSTPVANSQATETVISNIYANNNGSLNIKSIPIKTSTKSSKTIKWEDETITINSTNGIFIFVRFLTLKENDPDALLYTNGFYYTLAEKIPATFVENLKIKDMGILQGSITLTGDDYILEKIIMNFLTAYDYYSQNSLTKNEIVSTAHFLIRFGWIGVDNPEYYMEKDEWIECNLTGGIPQLQYTENNTLTVTLTFFSTSASFVNSILKCSDSTIWKRGTIVHIFENIFLLRANKNKNYNQYIISDLKKIYDDYKIKFFIDEEIFNNLIDFIENGKVPVNYSFSNVKLEYYEKWFLKQELENKDVTNNMLTLLNKMISNFPKIIIKEKDKEGKEIVKEYGWSYKFISYLKNDDLYYGIVIYNYYNKEYVPPELQVESIINKNNIKGYRYKNTSRSLLLNFSISLNNLFYQYMGNQFVDLNKENIISSVNNFEKKDDTILSYIKLKKDTLLPIFQGSASILGSLFWFSFRRKQKFLFHYEICTTQIYIDIKNKYGYNSFMSGFYNVMGVDHDISPTNWTVTLNLLKKVQKIEEE